MPKHYLTIRKYNYVCDPELSDEPDKTGEFTREYLTYLCISCCGVPNFSKVAEYPEDVTCKHCLRKLNKMEAEQAEAEYKIQQQQKISEAEYWEEQKMMDEQERDAEAEREWYSDFYDDEEEGFDY